MITDKGAIKERINELKKEIERWKNNAIELNNSLKKVLEANKRISEVNKDEEEKIYQQGFSDAKKGVIEKIEKIIDKIKNNQKDWLVIRRKELKQKLIKELGEEK